MERKSRTIKKVTLVSFALSAVICLGSCNKNAETSPSPDLALSSVTTGSLATTTAGGQVYTVDLTGLRSDGGYAYKLGAPLPFNGDSNTQPTISKMRLFENGVELGPAHSLHADIRTYGKGRFSNWLNNLIFSASDNTNPATNGRTYTYTLDGAAPATSATTSGTSTTTTTTTTTTSSSTSGANAGLLGYAMVNGTTTGGAGGSSVTVTTESALKSAVSGSSPKIVYVSGTITGAGDDLVYVGSNTSIIGKPGATLVGLSLFESGVNNVIIQDLRIMNYVSDAGVMVKYGTTHVWVDHCEFSTDRNNGWSYWGKDISMTRGADYCTISWCKFHDNNLSVLISGGIDGYSTYLSTGVLTAGTNYADDYGKLHITLHHNFWYNISEREPDMNTGSVHCFNNYHLNNGGYSIGCRAGGNVRTDNEYFSNCPKPISTNLAGDPPGYISGSNTNIYSSCGSNDITTSLANWTPGYSYTSAVDPAANVPSIVQQGTGPRAIH